MGVKSPKAVTAICQKKEKKNWGLLGNFDTLAVCTEIFRHNCEYL